MIPRSFGYSICFTASYKPKSLPRITNHSSYSMAIMAAQIEIVIFLEALGSFQYELNFQFTMITSDKQLS